MIKAFKRKDFIAYVGLGKRGKSWNKLKKIVNKAIETSDDKVTMSGVKK